GDQKTLQEAQMAEGGGDGEDCQGVDSIPIDRLLVSVEEFGRENDVAGFDASIALRRTIRETESASTAASTDDAPLRLRLIGTPVRTRVALQQGDFLSGTELREPSEAPGTAGRSAPLAAAVSPARSIFPMLISTLASDRR